MGAGISDRRKSVRADGYEEISGEPSGDVNTHSDDEVPLSDDDSSSFGSSLEITEERTDLSLSPDVFQSDPATSDEKGESVSGLTSYKQMTHQVSRAARASILGRPRKKRSVVLPTGEAVVITDGRTLNTLFGVFMPCVLAMFSLVLFLRVGTAVGQCGIYQSVALLCLGYFIILMTTLSICAISTNGEVEAGGAYFMISRTLGPEFGGALGLLLFISNVLSSATYIMSVTEAIIDSFGDHSGTLEKTLPEEYAYQLLYRSKKRRLKNKNRKIKNKVPLQWFRFHAPAVAGDSDGFFGYAETIKEKRFHARHEAKEEELLFHNYLLPGSTFLAIQKVFPGLSSVKMAATRYE